jgi:hypothetical protein
MIGSADNHSSGTFDLIFERILQHTIPLEFAAPWDFVEPQRDCFGPVADPTAVLADLRGSFDDGTLREAGVLTTSPQGGTLLNPVFTRRDTALVALRGHPPAPLKGLLTPEGCLPSSIVPALGVLQDNWTYDALSLKGVLYATPDIHEVALLRAIGIPATLSLHLDRMRYQGLEKVNRLFVRDPRVWLGAYQPTLALLGWSPPCR